MPKRDPSTLRTVAITPHYVMHPEGAALIEFGHTRVLCTASVEEKVPNWMQGKGRGWITAEYDMLPRATNTRNNRDSHRGKINGRTQEISRLIGRALRSVVTMEKLGERTITIDCDVLQADGGTRTAAITGGFVALALALKNLQERNKIKSNPLQQHVAAISVGIVDDICHLDLDYHLDSRAQVDMNVVMLENGHFVEVQGTGEQAPFDRAQLNTLLDTATSALPHLIAIQKQAIEIPFSDTLTTVRTPA